MRNKQIICWPSQIQILLLTYHQWQKSAFSCYIFLIPYNEFALIQPPPSHTLYPDTLLASIHQRESSLSFFASKPRSLPMRGGLVGRCSKQGAIQLQDMATSDLKISVQTQERRTNCWVSFWSDLELIFLNINRQVCSSDRRLSHCTTSLFSLEPVLIQKVFERRITIFPAKSPVCCWKKYGDKPFQNTHSKTTLILATKIQFGWALQGVDLTLFPEQWATFWWYNF